MVSQANVPAACCMAMGPAMIYAAVAFGLEETCFSTAACLPGLSAWAFGVLIVGVGMLMAAGLLLVNDARPPR